MKALWKNIKGTRQVVCEGLIVVVIELIVFCVAYKISGKVENVAIVAIAIAIVAVAIFAATTDKYKIKYYKVLVILLVEAFALFGAMIVFVPYLAIGVLVAACLGIVLLVAESKLRLWLSANEPPALLFEEEREKVGYGIFRESEVVTDRYPAPEPFFARLHRWGYKLYIN